MRRSIIDTDRRSRLLRIGLAVLAAAVPLTWACADKPAAAQVTIAEDGRPKLPIIAGSVKEPVDELARYLKQITGADFAVEKPGGQTAGIYVGLAADFPEVKVEAQDLGAEGFILKSAGGSLYLIAGEPLGVQQAVTTLLHKLGCRWFFPGAAWEVIPRQKTISLAVDERQVPSFPVARHMTYGFGAYAPCARDFKEWNRHNRMGGPVHLQLGHSWFGLDHVKDFKNHPDWFALVGGQRKASKPCYSHPDVIRQAINHALARAAAGDRMISMSPPDGLGYCECERCLAVCRGGERFTKHMTLFARLPDDRGVVSVPLETVFGCANQVAVAVAEKYPQVRIGCMAYSAYSQPPSFKLHPNLFLQVTTAYRRTDLTLAEQLAAFKKQGCQAGIRDYFSVYQWDWDVAPLRGRLAPDKVAAMLKGYQKNGVLSINGEASNNWAPRGLTYYMLAQLMWDLNADPKALLRDFYDKAFGPAAEPMQRYYIHWYGAGAAGGEEPADETGDGKDEGVDGQRLKLLFQDLDEAARRAKDCPDCLARIDHLRMYVHYLVLRQQTQRTLKGGDSKAKIEAVRAETVFGGQLTYTNMIHSRPLLGKAFLRRFRAFEKVLAGVPEAQQDNKGWRKIGQPPSHEELEQLWAEDRQVLQVKSTAQP